MSLTKVPDHDLEFICRQSARLIMKLVTENEALCLRCQELEATVERLHATLRSQSIDLNRRLMGD